MSGTHLIMPNPWDDKNNGLIEKQLMFNDHQEEFTNKLMKIAGNELREDENTRKQCLEQLRDWIKKNQDIENCLTGGLLFFFVNVFKLKFVNQLINFELCYNFDVFTKFNYVLPLILLYVP